APHIDVFETGQRGARVLRRILDGAYPVTAFQKIPFVVPAERANTQDRASVSHGFRQTLEAWERDTKILAAGLATVQPWLDIPEFGSAVLVVTDGDAELAGKRCADLAKQMWDRRRDYLPELVSVQEGVKAAFNEPSGLVVLSDSADATTSGAPGASSSLLREMLKYNWSRPALVTLVDPDLVIEATQKGVGAEFQASMGGKRDRLYASTLSSRVRVEKLFEARFVM